MRLGAYPCEVKKKTKAYDAYRQVLIKNATGTAGSSTMLISINSNKAGMIPSGINPESNLVEIIELKDTNGLSACNFTRN
jgi:CTP synthase